MKPRSMYLGLGIFSMKNSAVPFLCCFFTNLVVVLLRTATEKNTPSKQGAHAKKKTKKGDIKEDELNYI